MEKKVNQYSKNWEAQLWRGEMLIGLIGPFDEKWDICFIAEYPTVGSFIAMQKDKTYRIALEHRQIAVKTSDSLGCSQET